MKTWKVYLAGPEVFLPNAVEHAELQRQLCRKYDFEPLHPMDNNLDLGTRGADTAMKIFRGDTMQIRASDIVLANCNAYQGVCIDDGTAVEIGMGYAIGKIVYGYRAEDIRLSNRTIRDYPCTKREDGQWITRDGHLVVDDFGTRINLMMECAMRDSTGRLIIGDFEECLKQIHYDLHASWL